MLRLGLLPELIERRRRAKTLRLWSAGCSSGEEAYSLAILVDLLLPRRDGWDILILGSNIDQTALEKARQGRYGQWSFRMAAPSWQQQYFRRQRDEWVLEERIRRMVTFRAGDLILCRNVFIYFGSVAAYLELAALCERTENLLRAQTLRRAALDIVRTLPADAAIEPYETTAAEMAQWLAQ